VPWEKLAILVRNTQGKTSIYRFAPMDENGEAIFPALPPNEYTLSACNRTDRINQ